jgi:hypothetical protein
MLHLAFIKVSTVSGDRKSCGINSEGQRPTIQIVERQCAMSSPLR